MSFPRVSKGFAKRADRIPRDQIGGRQKGTARLFYKRPLRSQKLVVYPPAILSRGPRSRWIPLFFPFLLFPSFFLIHPRPIGTRARRLWTNARSTTPVHDLCPLILSPRVRFHLRLSRFDYLLGEAYRLLIYSVTNYDDLAGQRRYLFPLVRSGFWKRDRLELVFRGREHLLPAEKETTSYRWYSSLRDHRLGTSIYGAACSRSFFFFFNNVRLTLLNGKNKNSAIFSSRE